MAQKVLFETSLTETSDADIEGVGTLRYGDEGTVYRWVKNRSTTTAIVAKQPVCYNEANVGDSTMFQSVNEPETENLMLAAGMANTALAASAANALCFGWVTVQGYFKDALVSGVTNIVIGDELICADDANTLVIGSAPATAPKYSSHFVALETAISTSVQQSKDILVKCL